MFNAEVAKDLLQGVYQFIYMFSEMKYDQSWSLICCSELMPYTIESA